MFSFGTGTTTAAPTTTSAAPAFSFGGAGGTPGGSTGFQFGAAPGQIQTPQFGATTTTQASTTSPFAFGGASSQVSGNTAAGGLSTPFRGFGTQPGAMSSPSLFGTPATTSAPPATTAPTSVFGAAAGGGFKFGGTTAATTAPPAGAAQSGGLFGGTSTSQSSGGFATGSIFGGAASTTGTLPATTATSSLFGAPPTTTASGSGLFGNAPASQPFSLTTGSTTGTSKPAAGTGFFGLGTAQPTTAPTAATSATSLFGTTSSVAPTAPAASASSGLFSGAASTTAGPATTGASGLFNFSSSATQPQLFATKPNSGTQGASSGLFGQAQTTAGTQPSSASGIFGQTQAASGLLSALTTSTTSASTVTSQPSLFSQPPPATAPTPPAFGLGAATQAQQQPAAGSLGFGQPAGNTAAATSGSASVLTLASASSSQPQASSLAGQLAASTAPGASPSTSLFAPKAPTPTAPSLTTAQTAAVTTGQGVFTSQTSLFQGFSAGPAKQATAPAGGMLSQLQPSTTSAVSGAPQPVANAITFPQGLGGTPNPKVPQLTPSAQSLPTGSALPAQQVGQQLSTTSTTQPAGTTPVTNVTLDYARKNLPSLTHSQLEEVTNKWRVELEEQERDFLQKATLINAWDRLLVDNGQKMSNLMTALSEVTTEQDRVEQDLDFIAVNQDEMESVLRDLEAQLASSTGARYPSCAETQRQHMVEQAVNIDSQLRQINMDIFELREALPGISPGQLDDPMQEIARTIKGHVDTLETISKDIVALKKDVEDGVGQMKTMK